jgi:ElaB/YqjD/DUF883 family membrane-anchored ribosome-binding protein
MAEKLNDKRIEEALELLNELAKEKRDELKGMIAEKYGSLKTALGGVGENLGDHVRETYAQGEEKLKEMVSKVDDTVHKNPWPFIGGTALGFLILGYLFGKPRK